MIVKAGLGTMLNFTLKPLVDPVLIYSEDSLAAFMTYDIHSHTYVYTHTYT